MTKDEGLARDWLQSRGYCVEFEPRAVMTGRKPDFLATAQGSITPGVIWAEVKSIGPESRTVTQATIWQLLKELRLPPGLNGSAVIHVNNRTRPQSVRALVKLFNREAMQLAAARTRLIFIQQISDRRGE